MMKRVLAAWVWAAAGWCFGGNVLEEAVRPFVEEGVLPCCIAIAQKPGASVEAVFGVGVGLDTMFMQCSQTKGFCGVTVAMLVEEGRLGLDEPVAKYLP